MDCFASLAMTTHMRVGLADHAFAAKSVPQKSGTLSDSHLPVRPATSTNKDAHMTSITPFLWLDKNVPEAVAFYQSVFPNARVETVSDFMATFELEGQRFHALNGGGLVLHQRRDPARGGLLL